MLCTGTVPYPRGWEGLGYCGPDDRRHASGGGLEAGARSPIQRWGHFDCFALRRRRLKLDCGAASSAFRRSQTQRRSTTGTKKHWVQSKSMMWHHRAGARVPLRDCHAYMRTCAMRQTSTSTFLSKPPAWANMLTELGRHLCKTQYMHCRTNARLLPHSRLLACDLVGDCGPPREYVRPFLYALC